MFSRAEDMQAEAYTRFCIVDDLDWEDLQRTCAPELAERDEIRILQLVDRAWQAAQTVRDGFVHFQWLAPRTIVPFKDEHIRIVNDSQYCAQVMKCIMDVLVRARASTKSAVAHEFTCAHGHAITCEPG